MRLPSAAAAFAIALALCGCLDAEPGRLVDGDAAAGVADATAGDMADAAESDGDPGCKTLIDDTFDDEEIDAEVWSQVVDAGSGITAVEQGDGALHVRLQVLSASVYGRAGVVSMVQAQAEGTVLDVAGVLVTAGPSGHTGVGWSTTAGDYVAVYLEDGALVAARGTDADAATPLCDPCPAYVADMDRVRLRANADKIAVEVHGGDGWAPVGSTPNDLGEVHAALFAEGKDAGDIGDGQFAVATWTCDPDPLP